MSTEDTIINKLQIALEPQHLEVINESHKHNVPPGSESHFKVIAVADVFTGKMLIARHRMINQALQDELQGSVHALSLHTLTPEEWSKLDKAPESPPCMGGGKTS
ncbi:MAG: BolA/IbaG family iron-sulfur metabolism protein [Gammaproteobacteria bacterium]|nr:BolA/IbaG family iron-sulfur metabolism protein [Gammaproteobacteria bacterium]